MRTHLCKILFLFVVCGATAAASKPHLITFGKWTPIKWFVGPQEDKAVDAKVRPLYVDGKLKEFTLGDPHPITDRLFAVRRAVRINDALPQEASGPPRWAWQPGGWLIVDRVTGRVAQANLPDFDPYCSSASWYRDYVAYCGVSDDGKRLEALVVQAGRRKAVLKKKIGEGSENNDNQPACAAPDWQRRPMRVTFVPTGGDKQTYSIRGRAAEAVKDEEAAE